MTKALIEIYITVRKIIPYALFMLFMCSANVRKICVNHERVILNGRALDCSS